jgi:hypothetical protein
MGWAKVEITASCESVADAACPVRVDVSFSVVEIAGSVAAIVPAVLFVFTSG